MSDFFPDMTDAELAALDDATINQRIDLCCAERGIPLYVQEMIEPKPPVAPDFPLYEVGGVFLDSDTEAKALAASIQSTRRWKRKYRYWDSKSLDEWEQDESEIKIEIVQGYRPETWHQYRANLEQFDARKKAFGKMKEANTKAYDARASVAGEVWKDISAAKDRIEDSDRLRRLFDRYVELANGDRDIAKKFLVAAEHFDESWNPPASWSEFDSALVDAIG